MVLNDSIAVEKANVLSDLGRSKVYSDRATASSMGEEALLLATEGADERAQSLAFNLLSDCRFADGLHKDALELASKALKIQEILDEPKILVRSLTQMANNNLRISEYETSIEYYSRALEIHEVLDNQVGIALIHGNMSLVHKQLGNYAQSLAEGDKAIKMYKEMGNQEGEARSLGNKGTVLFDQGYHVESVKIHLQALKIRESLNDVEGIAQSLGCVGISLKEMGKVDDALEYLNQALEISQKIGDSYYITHYLSDIAGIYSEQSKFEKSLEYSLQALEQSRKGGVRTNEVYTLTRIDNIYKNMGNLDESSQFLFQAKDVATESGEKSYFTGIYNSLAANYLEQGKFDQAKSAGLKSLQYASKTDPVSDVSSVHQTLYNIHKARQDWKLALSHLESATELKEKYLEEQREDRITKLQSRYETEKAKREAELYKLKNVKLVKKNKKIKEQQKALTRSEHNYKILAEKFSESSGMKELLLDIVTHDLRNPAGVIYGMGQMLQETLPADEMLDVIVSSSEKLLNVLDHAKNLSMVSSDEDIGMDPLHLKTIVQGVLSDFSSQLNLHQMTAEMDISEGLNVIANPLIREVFENFFSNAIKYASQGKQINIDARVEGDQVVVSVKDRGDTIVEEERESIFLRTAQLNKGKSKGRGLGLAIVRKIVNVHKGECWVEPNLPSGNSFCVKLKLANDDLTK